MEDVVLKLRLDISWWRLSMYNRVEYVRGFWRFEVEVVSVKYGRFVDVVWSRCREDGLRKMSKKWYGCEVRIINKKESV